MAKVKAECPLVDVERLAVRRIVDGNDDSVCSGRVEPGKHHFDFTIRVQGDLEKGKDFVQVHAPSLPKMAIIQNLLSRLNGVTIESVIRDIQQKQQFDRPGAEEEFEERAAKAWKAIAGTQKKTMNGRVSLSAITVDVL